MAHGHDVFWVAGVTPTGTVAPEQEKAFKEATFVFLGAVLSVIGDKLVDAYLHMRSSKDLWEALESKFRAADAGSDCWKYALEAIIKVLLLYFLVHDNCLLFML